MSKKRKTQSYFRTDSGNAEMFAALNGKRVKFDHRQGRWLMWNEKQSRWVEDKQGKVRGLMKATARQRLRGMIYSRDRDARKKEVLWALKSESHYGINAALALAKSTPRVSDDGERWDTDPMLLGVANGVVDLRTGRPRVARPEDRVTIYSPVTFDPKATCPRFERFIEEICKGDRELASFIQRAVGYSLTGRTDDHVFFCCHGTGANGKSTFLAVLHHLFGATMP